MQLYRRSLLAFSFMSREDCVFKLLLAIKGLLFMNSYIMYNNLKLRKRKRKIRLSLSLSCVVMTSPSFLYESWIQKKPYIYIFSFQTNMTCKIMYHLRKFLSPSMLLQVGWWVREWWGEAKETWWVTRSDKTSPNSMNQRRKE